MDDPQFGHFRFDDATGVLFAGTEPIDLGSRGAALLRLLLARRGAVVGKAALIETAWGRAAIEESNLSVQIARLRRVMGPEDWIETVGRVGYRFRPERGWSPMAAGAAPRLALVHAVALEAAAEPFAPGLTEDLTIALSRFRSLVIVAGDMGNARYELSTSIRAMERQLRIGVRLVDRSLDRVIWNERFDAVATRSWQVSDEVIDAIAAQTEAQMQRVEIGEVLAGGQAETAYALYQRGRALTMTNRPDRNAEAIGLFERALALEPNNAAIAAAACDARAVRISMGWPAIERGEAERCHQLARDGLALWAGDATTRSLFGYGMYRSSDRDFGFSVIQGAAEINPNCLSTLIRAGTTSMHWGGIERAEAQYRRALRLAPAHPEQSQVLGGLSRIRMMQGRFKEARIWAQRALGVNEDYGAAHWSRIAASALLGQMDEARDYLAAFRRSQPDVTVASIRDGQPGRTGRMSSTLEGLELAGLPVARSAAAWN